MSRSYRKQIGGACIGNSKKDGKKDYNSQARSKTKKVLREAEKTNNTELVESLSTTIDYSLSNGDNWSWSSDGNYFVSDDDLHKLYLWEVNDDSLINSYLNYKNHGNNNRLSLLNKCMFDSVDSIETKEELKNILLYNEKEILKKYKKLLKTT